jgi:hypothetical protein
LIVCGHTLIILIKRTALDEVCNVAGNLFAFLLQEMACAANDGLRLSGCRRNQLAKKRSPRVIGPLSENITSAGLSQRERDSGTPG